jgi:hypothetical protein
LTTSVGDHSFSFIHSYRIVADLLYLRWYADGVVTTLAASFYAPHVLRFNRVIVKNECVIFLSLETWGSGFFSQTQMQQFHFHSGSTGRTQKKEHGIVCDTSLSQHFGIRVML